MTANHTPALHTLGDRGQTVAEPANDVRGRHVKDQHGDGIGKVADLLVDDDQNMVRFLLVEHGGFLGFGASQSLIPVDAVTKITQDDVIIDQSRERVAAAPGYAPDLADDRVYHASLYTHYGYAPYWGMGYMYPMGMAIPPTSPPVSDQ